MVTESDLDLYILDIRTVKKNIKAISSIYFAKYCIPPMISIPKLVIEMITIFLLWSEISSSKSDLREKSSSFIKVLQSHTAAISFHGNRKEFIFIDFLTDKSCGFKNLFFQ